MLRSGICTKNTYSQEQITVCFKRKKTVSCWHKHGWKTSRYPVKNIWFCWFKCVLKQPSLVATPPTTMAPLKRVRKTNTCNLNVIWCAIYKYLYDMHWWTKGGGGCRGGECTHRCPHVWKNAVSALLDAPVVNKNMMQCPLGCPSIAFSACWCATSYSRCPVCYICTCPWQTLKVTKLSS